MNRSKRTILTLLVATGTIASAFAPSAAEVAYHETVACGLWESVGGSDWMVCAGSTAADNTVGPETWAFAARASCIRYADDDWFCDGLNPFWSNDELLPTDVVFVGHERVIVDAALNGGCQLSVEFSATSPEYRSDAGEPSPDDPAARADVWHPALAAGSACGTDLPTSKATAGYIGELLGAG